MARTGVDSEGETKAIPARLRAEVLDRDNHCCRVCGAYVENPALHHIEYRSQGGLHVIENLVTVHWMYEPRCHEMAHDNKGRWQPILKAIAMRPGITALQYARWLRAAQDTQGPTSGPSAR